MTIELIRDERLRLVERRRALSDDDWDRPSLCGGWTPQAQPCGTTVTVPRPGSGSCPALSGRPTSPT